MGSKQYRDYGLHLGWQLIVVIFFAGETSRGAMPNETHFGARATG